MPAPFQGIFVFLMGLCVGSFLNVVIYRLPRGKSLVKPSSRCGFCRTSLRAWMNIPILSFLFTQGRCGHCGYAYSIRYPVVEALTAVVFLTVWSIYGWSISSLIYCGFAGALIALSFIDLDFRLIPDSLSLGGWAVALLIASLAPAGYEMSFKDAIIGSVVGYGCFWSLSKLYHLVTFEEGLGGGDVKLMGLVGAVLGLKGVIVTILVGSLLGSVVGLLTMLVYKKTRKFPIPFGPFLSVGAFASLFRLDLFIWPQ